jgi:uncharacterized membrane protein
MIGAHWRKRAVEVLVMVAVMMRFGAVPALANETPQDMTMEAEVVWMIEEREVELLGKMQPYQKMRLLITSGNQMGEEIVYEHGLFPSASVQTYGVGDRLVLGKSVADGEESVYYIIDLVRRPMLYVLFGIFVAVVILVARWRAIRSLLALAVSFGVIFVVVLPQLLAGGSPVFISMVAALIIIPVTFYLSHGFNAKTHAAIVGTVIALLVTALLAWFFVERSRLSGSASEEALFLQTERGSFNLQGLLLAGIIIGVLGILDDVTVSQAGIVRELLRVNPKLSWRAVYSKAMRVGTDHIASMINTLVLVYVGAAMPLLLLFLNSPRPTTEIINYEMVAEEIIRTLTGSIGLVLAVPLTTLVAVWWLRKANDFAEHDQHS